VDASRANVGWLFAAVTRKVRRTKKKPLHLRRPSLELRRRRVPGLLGRTRIISDIILVSARRLAAPLSCLGYPLRFLWLQVVLAMPTQRHPCDAHQPLELAQWQSSLQPPIDRRSLPVAAHLAPLRHMPLPSVSLNAF
jgi:hypothetical protein